MADLDLRKLSAPLEALRPEVDAAYRRLDAKWKAITEQLSRLPIPCDVGLTISDDPQDPEIYCRLEWRKWKGSKRICIVSYSGSPDGEGNVTPFEEWSAEERIDMLRCVPRLFESAIGQTKAFIARIGE